MNRDKVTGDCSNHTNELIKNTSAAGERTLEDVQDTTDSCIGDVQKTIFPKRQEPRPGEVPKSDGFGEE